MLSSIDFEKLRSEAKTAIENLEIWIRNIIDRELTKNYGPNFWEHMDADGNRLIRNAIVKEAKKRIEQEPERYPRFVDSLLLDDIKSIVCKNELYNNLFKPYLINAFPDGNAVVKTCLDILIPIRNKLYHANPISNHEALQSLCYSRDIIESIKIRYKEINVGNLYNAPMIIEVSDSFGSQYYESQIDRNKTGRGFCDTRKRELKVPVGEKLVIEVEIDPSFDPTDYDINWSFEHIEESDFIENGGRIEFLVENKHVKVDFVVCCSVTSKKEWHRCGDVDDSVIICYEIIPNE